MSPGTEFARDFCAGIGPLQLGVVLVCFCFLDQTNGHTININMCHLIRASRSRNAIGPILDDRLTNSFKIKKIVKNEKRGITPKISKNLKK